MTHTTEALSMEEPLLIALLVIDVILTVIGIVGRSVTHHPKWLMCNILGAMLVGLVGLLLSTTRGSPGDGEPWRARVCLLSQITAGEEAHTTHPLSTCTPAEGEGCPASGRTLRSAWLSASSQRHPAATRSMLLPSFFPPFCVPLTRWMPLLTQKGSL
jgi:hypothetical protein